MKHLQLADLEIREKLGTGLFSQVYIAQYDQTYVAVKMFEPRDYVDWEGVKEAIKMEIRTYEDIGYHNNIVQCLSIILENNEQRGIMLEYIKGKSLTESSCNYQLGGKVK